MTTLDLEPIKERLATATPGPWRVWRDPDPTKVRTTAVETAWCHGDIEGDTELITDYLPTDADAELIANAPSDLTALVAEVERLQPRQVTTYEALDGLPEEAVVRDAEGWIAQMSVKGPEWENTWFVLGDNAETRSSAGIKLPCTVLYTPEEDA